MTSLICILAGLWLGLFVLNPLAHAQTNSANRVESGHEVEPKDELNRSVVRLNLKSGLCSGTFITNTAIITAGHCTSQTTATSTSVQLRDSSGKLFKVGVKSVITHPGYMLEKNPFTRVKNDIGLIILKAPLPFAVRPLAITGVDDFVKKSGFVTVAGFGQNAKGKGSGILRWGTMEAKVAKLVNFFSAKGLFMLPLKTSTGEFTAHQIVCPGDSGGAVLRQIGSTESIIGVHSMSSGCKESNGPSSSSEILINYKAWIKQQVPELSSSLK